MVGNKGGKGVPSAAGGEEAIDDDDALRRRSFRSKAQRVGRPRVCCVRASRQEGGRWGKTEAFL